MILTFSPLAQAAPAGTATPATQADGTRQTYSAGTYLVQIAGDPVATYSKTTPAPGKRLNVRTEAVRDYVGRLKRQREKVLDEVPGVRPFYSYQYVFNGFAAKLTARQANALARTEGVLSLDRNEMLPLAATGDIRAKATATTATASSGALPVTDTAKFLGLKKPGGFYSKVPGGQANAGTGSDHRCHRHRDRHRQPLRRGPPGASRRRRHHRQEVEGQL
ncbi:hypothetical protein SALBM311S_05159 [Streptomyces alboniger]